MKKTLVALFIAITASTAVQGQDFDKYFNDATLRLDYIFAGNSSQTQISIAGLATYDIWAGRRTRLDSLALKGNGQVKMWNLNGVLIYCNSFSSLYNEWISTDLALGSTQAMECTVLVPMPKEKARVETSLLSSRGDIIAMHSYDIDPSDILIRHPGKNPDRESRYILHSGEPKDCIDVAITGEGYTKEESDKFFEDAARAVNSILSYEPFKSKKDKFNFIAALTLSSESGVSVPKLGQWKSTAYSSSYSTFYSDRYLTTSHIRDLHNSLDGLPYEHIIILANTEEYGGGGIYNSYTLTSARHKTFNQVLVHEFGHGFGGLADEYFYDNDDPTNDTYPTDVEPWEQNVTTMVDFDSKWKDLLPSGVPVPTDPKDAGKYPVGVYEGAAYSFHGLYRGADDCRMRTNVAPEFCPVCQKALQRIIEFYTE